MCGSVVYPLYVCVGMSCASCVCVGVCMGAIGDARCAKLQLSSVVRLVLFCLFYGAKGANQAAER